MTGDCAAPRIALGAYVLGALDPADRSVVEHHLAGCADCRAELSSLAGLPGLLGRLRLTDVTEADELTGVDLDVADAVHAARRGGGQVAARGLADPGGEGPDEPMPDGADGPVSGRAEGRTAGRAPGRGAGRVIGPAGGREGDAGRALTAMRRARRRARRRAALASAGLAAAAILAAVGITIALRPDGGDTAAHPAGHMFTATSATSPVEAWVWVAANPAGSAFTVRVENVRQGSHCVLIAQATDGHTETAATWSATYDGDVEVRGTSGIAPARLARLMIVDAHGGQLVVVPAGSA
ncbi:zf-HC2 domain-containing protein [Frankia sp. AiPa1]|uniref:zf-HC2 domain-containing protein n=1 Tax=Frankia sp. AiPa1 TaxID=573492 RepID=UPI002551E8FE|nr:zf-HC2 domain-containing protein [Frankia sp. AiPa1]MCL9762191.1 zf-HC2 domain-containing protein [Frankia sp. AiPa1]